MVKSFKGKIIKQDEEPEPSKFVRTQTILPELNVSKDEILASYIDQQ